MMKCKYQTPWTDEEGRYNSYLCIKDVKKCDYCCKKHKEKFSWMLSRKKAQFKDMLETLRKKIDWTIYVWTKK